MSPLLLSLIGDHKHKQLQIIVNAFQSYSSSEPLLTHNMLCLIASHAR